MDGICQFLLWSLLVLFCFIYSFLDYLYFPVIPDFLNIFSLGSQDCSLDSSCELIFDYMRLFLCKSKRVNIFEVVFFHRSCFNMIILESASILIPVKAQGRTQTPALELVLEGIANHPAANHTTTVRILISHGSLKPWVHRLAPPRHLPWKRFSQTAVVLSWKTGEIMSFPFSERWNKHTFLGITFKALSSTSSPKLSSLISCVFLLQVDVFHIPETLALYHFTFCVCAICSDSPLFVITCLILPTLHNFTSSNIASSRNFLLFCIPPCPFIFMWLSIWLCCIDCRFFENRDLNISYLSYPLGLEKCQNSLAFLGL